MTPRRVALAASVARYLPTLAGGSHVARVRSGLISVQLWPPSLVFQSVFDAKYSVWGSVGAKRTGAVRSTRKDAVRSARGATLCAWPVRRS